MKTEKKQKNRKKSKKNSNDLYYLDFIEKLIDTYKLKWKQKQKTKNWGNKNEYNFKKNN